MKYYFLVAENTISALLNTQSEQDTHAEPALLISGIDFRFSGHLAQALKLVPSCLPDQLQSSSQGMQGEHHVQS